MSGNPKKFYRFTNGKGDIDSQIMKKDMQAWTLRDVLHAGGLPPMETRTDVVDLFKPHTIKDWENYEVVLELR